MDAAVVEAKKNPSSERKRGWAEGKEEAWLKPTNKYKNTQTASDKKGNTCEGIKLNTNVPFIGDCITIREPWKEAPNNPNGTEVTQVSAFPRLMGGLTKIMMTLILSLSFLLVIVAGIMMVVGGANKTYYDKWIKLLKIVITALAVLGTSWIVLRLINPNFFGI